jgi:sugar O-acyltransferase (sialic acid O-acetyltransferase NeuD family)
MKKIIIIGASGNAIDILDTILDINKIESRPRYECVGFLDDDLKKVGLHFLDIPVLGPLEMVADFPDCSFVFGIGSIKNHLFRDQIINSINLPIERFESIIHPSAIISRMAHIGSGCIIAPHVVINNNAKLGAFVQVMATSVIAHDSTVGDYCLIGGRVAIAGAINIGENSYIGMNAAIRDNLVIGKCCVVGMGSVVVRDVSDHTAVCGNPARFLRNI